MVIKVNPQQEDKKYSCKANLERDYYCSTLESLNAMGQQST